MGNPPDKTELNAYLNDRCGAEGVELMEALGLLETTNLSNMPLADIEEMVVEQSIRNADNELQQMFSLRASLKMRLLPRASVSQCKC